MKDVSDVLYSGLSVLFVVHCVTTETEAVASRESATCSISLLFTWSS